MQQLIETMIRGIDLNKTSSINQQRSIKSNDTELENVILIPA